MIIDFSDLIGKPFHPDGYGPDNYSCYGLAVEVYKRYGISIPRTNISVCACKETSEKEIKENIIKYWEPAISLIAPTGLIIKSTNPDYANHIGVFIGMGRIIHVTIDRSVVIDRISAYKHKIIGQFKYVNNIN